MSIIHLLIGRRITTRLSRHKGEGCQLRVAVSTAEEPKYILLFKLLQ